ncbi:polysaccharide deacetylase family protein [Pyruvatibacter mobilis]|uniref:polysaccharide deacetylase WbmS family protein n=1 Tax=Pyruvatibacter mobilis TaxID=1712261 RepID=UPI003BACDEEF
MARYHLTFDIDWAPDCCIADVLTLLDDHDTKATFFVTHPCDVLKDIEAAGHRLGIHPNFQPNSSHGTTTEEIISYLLNIVPNATAMRTHGLIQSSQLLYDITSAFPQIDLDLSVFTYHFAHVGRFPWALGTAGCDRINFNWEDDTEFGQPDFDWTAPSLFGDINVLDFHPIHVGLNSRDGTSYQQLKADTGGQPLWSLSRAQIQEHKNPAEGAHTFLTALLASGHTGIDLDDIR